MTLRVADTFVSVAEASTTAWGSLSFLQLAAWLFGVVGLRGFRVWVQEFYGLRVEVEGSVLEGLGLQLLGRIW